MAGKLKPKVSQPDLSKDLWINPRSNLGGADGNRAWDNHGNINPASGARFLELADIAALGLKKPVPKKKRAVASAGSTSHDSTKKTEPYAA